jgi:hypothetical protein
MVTFQLLFFYSLGFAKVYAGGHATETASANSTSQLPSQIQSIQQCIWDHGIFCIMLDFLHYQYPSLDDNLSFAEQIERDATGIVSSIVGDCTFTSTDGFEEVSPCASSIITPSVGFRHSVTSGQCAPLSSNICMLTERLLEGPRPVSQLGPDFSMPSHDVQSQLYLMKRRFEIGIQMGLVLASMIMMAAALQGLLKLLSRLCLRMLSSNQPQNQRETHPQHQLPTGKIDRYEEVPKDLVWHALQEVN